ncbi:hypothetical protein Q8F55_003312 [Vanrija albida]|uniref:Uncharacterized protein n=1 Tax=Vanrija albida TaxID=181172 RepID=A0ABR3Q3K9_9TREE
MLRLPHLARARPPRPPLRPNLTPHRRTHTPPEWWRGYGFSADPAAPPEQPPLWAAFLPLLVLGGLLGVDMRMRRKRAQAESTGGEGQSPPSSAVSTLAPRDGADVLQRQRAGGMRGGAGRSRSRR